MIRINILVFWHNRISEIFQLLYQYCNLKASGFSFGLDSKISLLPIASLIRMIESIRIRIWTPRLQISRSICRLVQPMHQSSMASLANQIVFYSSYCSLLQCFVCLNHASHLAQAITRYLAHALGAALPTPNLRNKLSLHNVSMSSNWIHSYWIGSFWLERRIQLLDRKSQVGDEC